MGACRGKQAETQSLGGSEHSWALEFWDVKYGKNMKCGKTKRDIKRKGLSGSGSGDLSIYK